MTSRSIPFTPGEYYHLYNRGNNRNVVFFERANYLFFLYRLQQSLLPFADVVAYCLMPTHYHLLIKVKEEGLSRGMQRLGNSYTKAINTKYDRVGALFQGAFKGKHISKSSYLLRLSSYIHLNPVAANLVSKPEDWEFSSYREYAGLREEHGLNRESSCRSLAPKQSIECSWKKKNLREQKR